MKRLAQLRRAAGITQYALAQATKISRARISHFELGISRPTTEEELLIRRVLSQRLQGNVAILSGLRSEA